MKQEGFFNRSAEQLGVPIRPSSSERLHTLEKKVDKIQNLKTVEKLLQQKSAAIEVMKKNKTLMSNPDITWLVNTFENPSLSRENFERAGKIYRGIHTQNFMQQLDAEPNLQLKQMRFVTTDILFSMAQKILLKSHSGSIEEIENALSSSLTKQENESVEGMQNAILGLQKKEMLTEEQKTVEHIIQKRDGENPHEFDVSQNTNLRDDIEARKIEILTGAYNDGQERESGLEKKIGLLREALRGTPKNIAETSRFIEDILADGKKLQYSKTAIQKEFDKMKDKKMGQYIEGSKLIRLKKTNYIDQAALLELASLAKIRLQKMDPKNLYATKYEGKGVVLPNLASKLPKNGGTILSTISSYTGMVGYVVLKYGAVASLLFNLMASAQSGHWDNPYLIGSGAALVALPQLPKYIDQFQHPENRGVEWELLEKVKKVRPPEKRRAVLDIFRNEQEMTIMKEVGNGKKSKNIRNILKTKQKEATKQERERTKKERRNAKSEQRQPKDVSHTRNAVDFSDLFSDRLEKELSLEDLVELNGGTKTDAMKQLETQESGWNSEEKIGHNKARYVAYKLFLQMGIGTEGIIAINHLAQSMPSE